MRYQVNREVSRWEIRPHSAEAVEVLVLVIRVRRWVGEQKVDFPNLGELW